MSNATPAPTTKNMLFSKTIWLQIVMLLSVFFPPVQAWLAANPVEFVAVLGALNVLVRFATSGRISILGSDEAGSSGGKILPLLILGTMAGLVMGCLPSCSPGMPVRIGVTGPHSSMSYSSKGGLVIEMPLPEATK